MDDDVFDPSGTQIIDKFLIITPESNSKKLSTSKKEERLSFSFTNSYIVLCQRKLFMLGS
jgi:hypothetical protein